jgi:hypothetical protein
MAEGQHTPHSVFRLPITGRREGNRVVVAHALVRDDDFASSVLAPLFWNLSNMGYAYRREPRPARGMVLLHHLVFRHYHGPIPEGMEVDHKDRDPLNNQPENLRPLTHADNLRNCRRRKNKSGYCGVYLINKGKPKPWGARLKMGDRTLYLRYHATPEEAAAAVNDAYRRHFPHLNPPNVLPGG